jgi:hypothetical protein
MDHCQPTCKALHKSFAKSLQQDCEEPGPLTNPYLEAVLSKQACTMAVLVIKIICLLQRPCKTLMDHS